MSIVHIPIRGGGVQPGGWGGKMVGSVGPTAEGTDRDSGTDGLFRLVDDEMMIRCN